MASNLDPFCDILEKDNDIFRIKGIIEDVEGGVDLEEAQATPGQIMVVLLHNHDAAPSCFPA